MALPLDTLQNEPAAVPRLIIRRPDGGEFVHELASGNGAIAGSDRTCSLHLDGEDVAALHCMIRFENGQIHVKDWYSESGTFVNDQKIHTETILPEGGVLRIGKFSITVRYESVASREESPVEVPDNASADACEQPSQFDLNDNGGPDTTGQDDSNAEFGMPPFDETAPEFGDHTVEWFDQTDSSDDDHDFLPSNSGLDADGCDPETFALLQSEVEHLQNELAQRDARLEELTATADAGDHSVASVSNCEPSETAALVDRLEQLLDELNQSDERMATMEELLRLAEEANVADREERRQIDGWVGDIECRIGEKESEWTAEMDVLRQRIEEVSEERNRLELRIGQAGASKEQQAEFQRILLQVRGQADAMRARLDESEAEKAQLEARLEELNGEGLEKLLQQRVDEVMREERLIHAQEQATMARERAELSRVKMELERSRESKMDGQNEIDGKFRAFRDHLKDLQVQESQEKQERSLSSRLSKLWKRLEGRSS